MKNYIENLDELNEPAENRFYQLKHAPESKENTRHAIIIIALTIATVLLLAFTGGQ